MIKAITLTEQKLGITQNLAGKFERVNSGTSYQPLGKTETEPQFKVSSKRLNKGDQPCDPWTGTSLNVHLYELIVCAK